MLTKWFSSTRLGSRPEESNINASIWVLNLMRNESEGFGGSGRDLAFGWGAPSTDRSLVKDVSMRTSVGTRGNSGGGS